MKSYIARRLLLVIPTLIGISIVSFALLQLAPGNPVSLRLMKLQGTMGADVPPEVIEQTKALYGLDKPVHVQYGMWLKRMLTFDFGESFKDRQPVLQKIGEALPATIQINALALLLMYTLAVPIGIFSAVKAHTVADTAVTVILFIMYSLPNFWVAMLLLYFLANDQYFDWFPAYGISSLNAEAMPWGQWLLDRLWHLVLPVFCMTYYGLAAVSRYARSGMIDVVNQDYIRTARAYGFSERTVIFKYALRNSLIPIITLFGTLLPALLGGSVIIESIFSIPGMGRLAFESILNRDYPTIMGILTISAFVTLVGLIISDLLYGATDPRIRFK
jgi:peptide/nickel transport system permease protein